MKSTRFWLLLIGIILVIASVASVAIFHGRIGDAVAMVYQDGECIRTIDLYQVDEPFSFTVEWDGGYNLVEVEHGRIRVSQADCPDLVCVSQGWIADGIVPIACLPHHLAIRLVSRSDSILDAATG